MDSNPFQPMETKYTSYWLNRRQQSAGFVYISKTRLSARRFGDKATRCMINMFYGVTTHWLSCDGLRETLCRIFTHNFIENIYNKSDVPREGVREGVLPTIIRVICIMVS